MAHWARRGLPAGISTLLAFVAGVLTDILTGGWNWPVGVGLAVLLAAWIGWEIRQAATRPERPDASTAGPVRGHAAQPEPVVPRQLPAAVAHFAGRTTELETLTSLVRADGTVAISAIGGTAGVGKPNPGL